MILWNVYQQLVELFVSSMLILFYGFYIFGTGVAQDLSHSMVQNYETDVTHPKDDDDMPPIVFVHGFFGFGSFGKRVSPIFFISIFFLNNFFSYNLINIIKLLVHFETYKY